VTWTKLGDEFSDETRDLTDAEVRTHVDALNWSNRRGLDLHVPKRDLRRFAESPAAGEAVEGLVVKDWWEDRGDSWYVGLRFPEWQLSRAVIDERREAAALRKRRQRLHKAGDHSLCIPGGPCPDVTRDGTRDGTRDPVRFGSGTTYPPEPAKDQDQDQGSGITPEKAKRSGAGVRGRRSPRPPEADVKASRRESAPRVPASVQTTGAGLNPLRGKLAKPASSPRLDNDGSDDQQRSIPVTHQSPSADRNAREALPYEAAFVAGKAPSYPASLKQKIAETKRELFGDRGEDETP
jgi:hypothetical protein